MNIQQIFELLSISDDYFEDIELSFKTENIDSTSTISEIFHAEQEPFVVLSTI